MLQAEKRRTENKKKKSESNIEIKGARTHNLKNIDVVFPRNQLIVVTGVSGSGKSSLTIDTLFAEGQRRYAESLSAYARQFMARMDKPDVDFIKGLCPAIAIEQKVVTRTPRSTVGSMTEIYDYLRLMYARLGKTISPVSGQLVRKDDVADVVNEITSLPEGARVVMLVAFKQHANRQPREELNILTQKGFSRMYLAGKPARIEDLLAQTEDELLQSLVPVDEQQTPPYILVDRIVTKAFDEDDLHRISDSVNTAFYEGEGEMYLEIDSSRFVHFSNKFELDGIQFEEPVPNLFSFNNPYGACPECEGFGMVLGIDPDLVIPDKKLSVYEGAVAPWKGDKLGQWRDRFIRSSGAYRFPIHTAICDLTEQQLDLLWKGNGTVQGIHDFFSEVEQNLYKVQYRVLLSRYRGKTSCPTCHGYRLRPEALYVKINDRHIGQLCLMQVKDLQQWFLQLQVSEHDQQVGKRILIEIKQRLQTLTDVGLGYLTLNRLANTLSGGESQRIQITRSLGSNLTNSLYILDEPSIGLHPRDTEKLISVLKDLRDLNNTVVVVEHDEQMMREADYIIDMGPLASHLGGEVTATGYYDQIINNPDSLTGKYLKGELTIQLDKKPRTWTQSIRVENARQNNLKDITVQFPLNVLCVVSGVSGSGKTTLVKQVLYPALRKLKGEFADKVGFHKTISGDVDAIIRHRND